MRLEMETIFRAAHIAWPKQSLSKFLFHNRIDVGQGWFTTPGLKYDGTPGMTVARIRSEHDLTRRIAKLLDLLRPADSALRALKYVRSELWREGSWKWAFVAESTPILSGAPAITRREIESPVELISNLRGLIELWPALFASFFWPFISLVAVGFVLGWYLFGFATGAWIGLLLFVAELIGGWLAYCRLLRLEKFDHADEIQPVAAHIEEIMKRENFAVQNHMAAVSTMKPGQLRRLTLRIGLWAAYQIALRFSRPGFLAGTDVIHFGRWVRLPGTKKLLFFSNYDGAWESYLEDFIQRSAQGVTGIWSNTIGFPRTSNLFFGGASDGNRLRLWTRRQQNPTRFWYTAYPNLSLARIRLNAAVRQGLANAQTETEAADWLSCFGSAPRPPSRLEKSEIPTLIFGGLRRLAYATCLFLRLNEDCDAIKSWLQLVKAEVSYGSEYVREPSSLIVGLTYSGLRKLNLEDSLGTFPVAFQQGSAAPYKARALGDTDVNDPAAGCGVVLNRALMRWYCCMTEITRNQAARTSTRTDPSTTRAFDRERGDTCRSSRKWSCS